MQVIVLQHLSVEHPGIFRNFFKRDGHVLTTVELDEGEQIPDLTPFDMMLVMGGPQDVWQEDVYPWLRAEKAAIRLFVKKLKRPYLGICLGHQLLGDAIGADVALADRPEVGVTNVSKVGTGSTSELLRGVETEFPVVQWHSAEVKNLPRNAHVLASSPDCAIQALSYEEHAFGLQFHIEVTSNTVSEWAAVPTYAASLEAVMGHGALAKFEAALTARQDALTRSADVVYRNFMKIASGVLEDQHPGKRLAG